MESAKCLKCGHTWILRKKKPKQCPGCTCRKWETYINRSDSPHHDDETLVQEIEPHTPVEIGNILSQSPSFQSTGDIPDDKKNVGEPEWNNVEPSGTKWNQVEPSKKKFALRKYED